MYLNAARLRPIGALFGLAILVNPVSVTKAAGFALIEHGASGLGNAYAGAAAVSVDGSTVWFNPAGMSDIDNREVAFALHILDSSTKFTDRGSELGSAVGGGPVSGADTDEAGTTEPIPNFYYVAPISKKWSYGLSVGAPFGSGTEYDRNWKGRYATVETSLTAIDINPALSYRVSDKVRLGFGISLQQLSAELATAVDSGSVCLGLISSDDPEENASYSLSDCLNAGLTPGNQPTDSFVDITGDSIGFGFNLGALFVPTPDVRIGLAYRHKIDHEVEGDAVFTVNSGLQDLLDSDVNPETQPETQNIFRNVPISSDIKLPAAFSVSGAWQFNDRLQLLSDITWTGWSSFQELRVVFDNPAQSPTTAIQDWEDVFRYSLGLNYQLNAKLLLRAGIALDEEAIPSPQRRSARSPGNDRTWFAIGAGYRVSNKLSFDLGYTHILLDDAAIDNDSSSPDRPNSGTIIRGEYDASVDILSAQLNWEFN